MRSECRVMVKEKGMGVGKETKKHPLSFIPYPQVFQQPDLEVEKGLCRWRKEMLSQHTS